MAQGKAEAGIGRVVMAQSDVWGVESTCRKANILGRVATRVGGGRGFARSTGVDVWGQMESALKTWFKACRILLTWVSVHSH